MTTIKETKAELEISIAEFIDWINKQQKLDIPLDSEVKIAVIGSETKSQEVCTLIKVKTFHTNAKCSVTDPYQNM